MKMNYGFLNLAFVATPRVLIEFVRASTLTLAIAGCAVLMTPSQAGAQMSIDEIEKKANEAVKSGKYGEAIPYLQEVIKEARAVTDPQLKDKIESKLQRIEFLLAFCYVVDNKYDEAITSFNAFIEAYPKSRRIRQALTLKAYAESLSEKWAEAEKSITRILTEFRRDLPRSERAELFYSLALAELKLGKFDDAYKRLENIALEARDPALRMVAISQMLETIFASGDSQLLYNLVPALQGQVSPARYSFQFNLKAIEGADKLMADGNHRSAFVLLKLCQSSANIQDGLDKVQQHLENQRKRLSEVSADIMENFQKLISVEQRLATAKAEKEALEKALTYDEGLSFRIAQVFFELELFYESYWAYLRILDDFPESSNRPDTLFAVSNLAGQLELPEEAERYALQLIKEYPKWKNTPDIVFSLAYLYQQQEELDKMISLLDQAIADEIITTNNDDKGHAYYLSGFARLFKDDAQGARKFFEKVRQEAANSNYLRDAEYWDAYISLMTDEFQEAEEKFGVLVNTHQSGRYIEDAEFRQVLARFGLGDLEGARNLAEDFLQKYPRSALLGELYNVLGDIYGSFGELDKAIDSYLLVEKFTDREDQIDAAVFNAARVMEVDQRWEQIVEHFQSYINRFGEEGKYTLAVYRMGAAFDKLGEKQKAMDLFWETFLRFAEDPNELGADAILSYYVDKYPEMIVAPQMEQWYEEQQAKDEADQLAGSVIVPSEAEQQAKLEQRKQAELKALEGFTKEAKREVARRLRTEFAKSDDKPTKQMRLAWGLSMLGDESKTPENFTKEQISNASPAVLSWMSEIFAERDNIDNAFLAAERIMKDFPQTQWTPKALATLGMLEGKRGNKDKAKEYYNEIYEYYPTSEYAGEATMQLADMEVGEGKYEEAIPKYEEILMVREWRGRLWPEALYKLGISKFEMGEVQEAFAFFQRVYVLYATHTEWAAKSYLKSGECLELLGKQAEAAQTYREMLSDASLADRPELQEAQKRLDALPAAAKNPPTTAQN